MTTPGPRIGDLTIVLVGLMGAGKTSVGRRLAERLGLDFVDADSEIEKAAGMPVSDIFATHGEAHFREGERRVIARLLDSRGTVLATGGGAFMDPETRKMIAERGLSVWLKADLDLLVRRVSRRNTRPLLHGRDARETLCELMRARYPVYAEADVTVESRDIPHEAMVERIVTAIERHLAGAGAAGGGT